MAKTRYYFHGDRLQGDRRHGYYEYYCAVCDSSEAAEHFRVAHTVEARLARYEASLSAWRYMDRTVWKRPASAENVEVRAIREDLREAKSLRHPFVNWLLDRDLNHDGVTNLLASDVRFDIWKGKGFPVAGTLLQMARHVRNAAGDAVLVEMVIHKDRPQWDHIRAAKRQHVRCALGLLLLAYAEWKRDGGGHDVGRRALSTRARFAIFKRDGYRCRLCGATADDGARLEVDHIRPVARGGASTPSNLWTLCRECNSGKSDRLL